jgi:predicted transcriptional regulator
VRASLVLPCEIAVKSVVPAIRAAIARDLVEKHGFTQAQVAEILGISQPAVCKYTRRVRGQTIDIENLENLQGQKEVIVSLLMGEEPKRAALLGLFCQMCMLVRKEGLMCPLCHRTDLRIKSQGCDFCLDAKPTSK